MYSTRASLWTMYAPSPLQTVTKLKMDALAVMHYDSGVPGSSFTGDGDLRFQQRCVRYAHTCSRSGFLALGNHPSAQHVCLCATLKRSWRSTFAPPLTPLLTPHQNDGHCRAPLPYVVGGIYTPYLLAPLSNFSTATTLDQVQPNCILSAYRSRNC
jgi:hypothetical protein